MLRNNIPVEDLPRTFRDAVGVTESLGLSHIWIDSLCIFQDHLEDWENEAASMRDVYSNALFNLAATSAKDGSAGLFSERLPTAEGPFWVATDCIVAGFPHRTNISGLDHHFRGLCQVIAVDHWEHEVDKGFLNRRAWVMQERFLSTSGSLHGLSSLLGVLGARKFGDDPGDGTSPVPSARCRHKLQVDQIRIFPIINPRQILARGRLLDLATVLGCLLALQAIGGQGQAGGSKWHRQTCGETRH